MVVLTGGRTKNRRGEGGLLRDEIVAGANTLLESSGREEAVTLRAVARQVGIAAPSIYQHFADRDAVLDAVVAQAFQELIDWLTTDLAPITDPLQRLWTGCETYVRFAATHPQRYRVMFGRTATPAGGAEQSIVRPMPPEALESFGFLVRNIEECVAAGVSESTAPFDDAVALWISLHGLATLECFVDEGWPTRQQLLSVFVNRLCRVRDPQ